VARGARQIVSIQYLRALAAIGVVLHHFLGPAFINRGLAAPASIGEAGVDLFFVISGFIMWVTTRRTESSPKAFIYHRLIRIVPLYWIFTFVFLAIKFASRHAEPISLEDLVRSLFFIPVYDASLFQKTSAFYFLGWTLMYEMFFYGIFAAALLLPRGAQLVAVITSLLFLAGLGTVLTFDRGMSFTYTSPLLLEFAAGCAIGKLYEKRLLPSHFIGCIILLVGALALVSSVWNIPESLHQRMLLWGLPCALIVFGALSLEDIAWRRPSPTFLLLGNASYSIYLSHIIFLLMFNLAIQRMKLFDDMRILVAIYLMVGSTLAVIGGIIVHELIERPILRSMRQGIPRLLRL
jgi:exopolysaccharide production protein ExoZ